MATGTVVRFNGTNGYGFITPDDGGEDVFVHASLLSDRFKDEVPPGTRVEFEAVKGERGFKAVAVTVLSTRPASLESRPDDHDDHLCDVIGASEFTQTVTDVLIDLAPAVTGAQIVEVRKRLLSYARKRGWIED